MFCIDVILSIIESIRALSPKFKFLEITNCVSNSEADPVAIPRKCTNSLFEFLPDPSAIFEGIETPLLFICETSPNRSSEGNDFVS